MSGRLTERDGTIDPLSSSITQKPTLLDWFPWKSDENDDTSNQTGNQRN